MRIDGWASGPGSTDVDIMHRVKMEGRQDADRRMGRWSWLDIC